jgi:hypothetical protein
MHYTRCLPVRRFDPEQVVNEEIVSLALPVRTAVCVPGSGKDEEVEGLVGLDERIHHLVARRPIDVRMLNYCRSRWLAGYRNAPRRHERGAQAK